MSTKTNDGGPLDETITVEERRFVITTAAHLEAWRNNPASPLAGRHVIDYVPVKLESPAEKEAPAKPKAAKPAAKPATKTSGDTPKDTTGETQAAAGDVTGEQAASVTGEQAAAGDVTGGTQAEQTTQEGGNQS